VSICNALDCCTSTALTPGTQWSPGSRNGDGGIDMPECNAVLEKGQIRPDFAENLPTKIL
jgi:hypothetical protein